ncbi:MAG: hypothetical protein CMF17_11780 [Idiomarinaceae bacterium]|nr:hypothetical protein [Idiomarinaceae bacterium]
MAKSDATTKVAANKDGKDKNGNKDEENKGRKPFDIKNAKALIEDENGNAEIQAASKDGKLIAVPRPIVHNEGSEMEAVPLPKKADNVVSEGFMSALHKPLVKGDFASEDVYLEFRAFLGRARAAKLLRGAKTLETRADKIRKFGDEKTRKKAAKLERMKEQMAALEKELEEAGVDLDEEASEE